MKYRLHTLLAASALATSCYTSLSVAQTVAGSPATRPQAPIAPHAKKPDNVQGKKETILVKGRAASGALA